MFDNLLKFIPIVGAFAIAVLSAWRDADKHHRPADRRWYQFSAPGWLILGVLAASTLAGGWSIVREGRKNKERAAQITMLEKEAKGANDEAAAANRKLDIAQAVLAYTKEQLQGLRGDTSDLKTITTLATDNLGQQQKQFAESLGTQEKLTLSAANKPSYGIVDFEFQKPVYVPPGGSIHYLKKPLVAAMFDRNLELYLPFSEMFDQIKWLPDPPICFFTWLGKWEMLDADDSKAFGGGWDGSVCVEHYRTAEKKPPDSNAGAEQRTEDLQFQFTNDNRDLVFKLRPMLSQNMLNLWNGPKPQDVSAEIQIAVAVEDANSRERLKQVAGKTVKAVKAVTAYYSFGADGLCQRFDLGQTDLHVAWNLVRFDYRAKGPPTLEKCPPTLQQPTAANFPKTVPD